MEWRINMLKVIICVLAFAASPALAAEISLKLDDNAQKNIQASPQAMEQCVNAAIIHSDGRVCRQVYDFMAALAAEAKKAADDAAKPKPEAAPNASK